METYINEAKTIDLLSSSEELTLGRRVQAGDMKARDALIVANLRLVVLIAHKFRMERYKINDLIQEGNIGLIKAAEKFDPEKGIRFSTYAAWWIKQRMKAFVSKDRNIVSIKDGKERKIFNALRRVERELEDQGIEATDEAIADVLGVKPKDIREMRGRLVGQDAPLHREGEDMEVEDNRWRPDNLMEQDNLSRLFREAVEEFTPKLKGKEWVIFTERLTHEDPASLEEIADHYGVSREAVRLWEKRLRNRFQVFLNRKLGIGCHLAA